MSSTGTGGEAGDPAVRLETPLSGITMQALRAGDRVLLSGVVYTARDAAHARMISALAEGRELPIPLEGQVVYYVGPTPAVGGRPIGSAGPTTASRMDSLTVPLLARGLSATIGKGRRGAAVREAMVRHGAVYLVAVGGAAVLLSDHIVSAEVVAYPELGPEAIRRLVVHDLPLVVGNDLAGGDLFESGRAAYHAAVEAKPAAGGRSRPASLRG